MADITREFHFVFGLREQHEPFHIVHYLSLESCRRINRPKIIHLHLRHRPYGIWWDRIAPHLKIHTIKQTPLLFDATRYADSNEGRYIVAAGFSYAHEADFLRLQILLEHGGVYADMDTLFVRPYPDEYYASEFLIGEEAAFVGSNGVLRPSLCNALMFAKPQARFVREWLARMSDVFDGTWNRHSCDEAARLWGEIPETVNVVAPPVFYPFGTTRHGIAALFDENTTLPRDCCSIHLWAHLWWQETRIDFTDFHANCLNAEYIRTVDTTYTVQARRFLGAGFDDAE